MFLPSCIHNHTTVCSLHSFDYRLLVPAFIKITDDPTDLSLKTAITLTFLLKSKKLSPSKSILALKLLASYVFSFFNSGRANISLISKYL